MSSGVAEPQSQVRQFAAGHAVARLSERFGVGLDEAVFEGPPAGGGGFVVPSVVAERVAYQPAPDAPRTRRTARLQLRREAPQISIDASL